MLRRLKDEILEATTQVVANPNQEVTSQEVVNPDQEVISQESSSVDQDMSSQDTDNDWEGGAWGEMDG